MRASVIWSDAFSLSVKYAHVFMLFIVVRGGLVCKPAKKTQSVKQQECGVWNVAFGLMCFLSFVKYWCFIFCCFVTGCFLILCVFNAFFELCFLLCPCVLWNAFVSVIFTICGVFFIQCWFSVWFFFLANAKKKLCFCSSRPPYYKGF